MGLKLFGTKGVDKRKNYLTRDQSLLSDALNIRRTKNDEYSKRSGQKYYQEDNPFMTTQVAIATASDRDYVSYKKNNSVFYTDGEDFYDSSRGGLKVWGYGFDLGKAVSVGRKIGAVESLGCLLFTHYKEPLNTMYYDGKDVYFAGLPAPRPHTQVANSNGTFNLFYYSLIDNQGNEISGPSTIVKSTTSFKLNISELDGFRKTELLTRNSKTISPTGDRTIEILWDSYSDLQHLKVGDKIPVRSYGVPGRSIWVIESGTGVVVPTVLMLEVESMSTPTPGNPTVITFTAESFKGHEISLDNTPAGDMNFHCGLILKQWFSEDEFTGYSREADYFLEDVCFSVNRWTTGTFNTFTYFGQLKNKKLLSAEYDLTTSKIRPPVCKYLYMYGYQLVCGNIVGFWDFENKLNSYSNNDLIMYSDLNLGDTPVSFSESNRQLIGETQDGEVTAMGRVNDSLMVFKDRGIHAIDGVLLPGAYSKRTISTRGIGCDTFKSLVEADGLLFFQSYNGIYATNGFKITEVSQNFFNMFDDIDTSKSRGVNNPDFDEVLMFCKGVVGSDYVFAFNYKDGGVYIWNAINANWGFLLNNERNVLIFGQRDDNKVLTLDPQLRDVDQPINAFIRSSFLDLGEPGLLKKINEFRIYSFSNKGQNIDFKLMGNWNVNKVHVSSSIEELRNADIKTKEQKTGTFTAMSFALELSNNVIDEDLCISDFELDIAINQTKDKNVK